MNQNEREGQSMGRTTGESGIDAEQDQDRTIQGQESEPGKVWQDSTRSQHTGEGDTSTGATGKSGSSGSGASGYGEGSSAGSGYGAAGSSSSGVGGGTGGESSGGSAQGSYGGQSGQAGQSGQSGHSGQSGESGQGGQGHGGATGEGGIRGGFNDTRGSSSEDVSEEANQQMDESQWQGSRFSQGGSSGNNPGSNG